MFKTAMSKPAITTTAALKYSGTPLPLKSPAWRQAADLPAQHNSLRRSAQSHSNILWKWVADITLPGKVSSKSPEQGLEAQTRKT